MIEFADRLDVRFEREVKNDNKVSVLDNWRNCHLWTCEDYEGHYQELRFWYVWEAYQKPADFYVSFFGFLLPRHFEMFICFPMKHFLPSPCFSLIISREQRTSKWWLFFFFFVFPHSPYLVQFYCINTCWNQYLRMLQT